MNIFNTLFRGFIAALSLVLLLLILYRKRQIASDQMIIDLGLAPDALWRIMLGVFLTAISIGAAIDKFPAFSNVLEEFVKYLHWLPIGMCFVYLGFQRIIITDRAIYLIAFRVAWTNIRSFQWEGTDTPVLKLYLIQPWLGTKQVTVRIPKQYVAKLQDLLV